MEGPKWTEVENVLAIVTTKFEIIQVHSEAWKVQDLDRVWTFDFMLPLGHENWSMKRSASSKKKKVIKVFDVCIVIKEFLLQTLIFK